jgi:biopolymer transport protein ExbD
MITRPLDLASRLQPEPRNFDAFFFVNVGMVALFFSLFGSQFVLSPGVELPSIAGARASGAGATSFLKVLASGQLLTNGGLLPDAQLSTWLKTEAHRVQRPVLLIEADRRATAGQLTTIINLARSAGFLDPILAAEDSASTDGGKH